MKCEHPGCEHPKYEVSSVTKHTVWTIEGTDGLPLAEIHLGLWTPGKYSVRLRRGLETFVAKDADTVREMDTIQEAAELVDVFLHCGAPAHFRAMRATARMWVWSHLRADMAQHVLTPMHEYIYELFPSSRTLLRVGAP